MNLWSETERANLEQDINRRLESIPRDKEYKEHYDSHDT